MSQAAYLRVYVPEDEVGSVRPHLGGIRSGVMIRGEFGVWHESVRDDAFVMEIDGTRFVCPRNPRLRALEGLLAFRHAHPGATGSTLIPEGVFAVAAAQLERLHDHQPGTRSYILTSSFFVPLRWFTAFDPGEREVIELPDGHLSIRYRTRIGPAKRRLLSAVDVLETVGFDESLVEQVQMVVDWLDDFPASSWVELDYGGVARLFDSKDLALDESAAEVGASLEALRDGDLEAAGVHYAKVAQRWARVQAITYSN